MRLQLTLKLLFPPCHYPQPTIRVLQTSKISKLGLLSLSPMMQLPTQEKKNRATCTVESYFPAICTIGNSYRAKNFASITAKNLFVKHYHCAKICFSNIINAQKCVYQTLPLHKNTFIKHYHCTKIRLSNITTAQKYVYQTLALDKNTFIKLYHCTKIRLPKIITAQKYVYQPLPLQLI